MVHGAIFPREAFRSAYYDGRDLLSELWLCRRLPRDAHQRRLLPHPLALSQRGEVPAMAGHPLPHVHVPHPELGDPDADSADGFDPRLYADLSRLSPHDHTRRGAFTRGGRGPGALDGAPKTMMTTMKLDFIGVGPMRAGTTWLHHALSQHPEIVLPREKETFYFDRYFDRGEAWYAAHFEERLGSALYGEIGASYFSSDAARERIYASSPGALIIVSVREPAERAFSSFIHLTRP